MLEKGKYEGKIWPFWLILIYGCSCLVAVAIETEMTTAGGGGGGVIWGGCWWGELQI